MLSVYKTKGFARFARKARIDDQRLWEAARLANEGVMDADLGGGVVKQRIARAGEGKSGGSRSILLLKKNDRAVYIYGFEKKDRPNINQEELEGFREVAALTFALSHAEIERRVRMGALLRVECPSAEENDAEEI